MTISHKSRLRGLFTIFTLLVAIAVLLLNRWNIYDWLRLRGYTPPSQIAQLATDTTMNAHTRQLFYVYHPDLESKTDFTGHCHSGEQTIVLGCYVGGIGIYIYNVTDPRLEGVLQVTAAHETLHAAYDRLSATDKKNVDALINQAYAKVTDQRIRDNIESYRKNGADVTNELHSILGTEVRDLPPELEQYYTRYFTNRKAIVAYSEKYEQAFTERKQEVANDDKQLDSMRTQINQEMADLSSQQAALNSLRAQLDAWLAAKNYNAYNAEVPDFNNRVAAYNALVVKARNLIDQYNALVAQRNSVALEENQLFQAIDSRPDTLQGQ